MKARLFHWGEKSIGAVFDFLLPPRCPSCRKKLMGHGHLCSECWGELKPISNPCCEKCGLPFDFAMPGVEGEDNLCGGCIADPPEFDWARSAVLYDGAGKRMVLGLKHGAGESAPAMAKMMAWFVGDKAENPLLIPVPLHPKRLLARRFNQSQLLLRQIQKLTGAEADAFVLVRKRPTQSQGAFGRKGRFRNVRGAFQVVDKSIVKDRHVILVDDVYTTGATLRACTAVLKKAGAASVGAVTFARVRGKERI